MLNIYGTDSCVLQTAERPRKKGVAHGSRSAETEGGEDRLQERCSNPKGDESQNEGKERSTSTEKRGREKRPVRQVGGKQHGKAERTAQKEQRKKCNGKGARHSGAAKERGNTSETAWEKRGKGKATRTKRRGGADETACRNEKNGDAAQMKRHGKARKKHGGMRNRARRSTKNARQGKAKGTGTPFSLSGHRTLPLRRKEGTDFAAAAKVCHRPTKTGGAGMAPCPPLHRGTKRKRADARAPARFSISRNCHSAITSRSISLYLQCRVP